MEPDSTSVNIKNDKKTSFVIMPFSKTYGARTAEYWENHYESFLKPLILSCGLSVSRSQPLRQDILRGIIHQLVYSDIVIADLTDHNANVFWELGVRQSFQHCSITIIDENSKKISRESPARIPFDISRKGTLTYSSQYPNKYSFSELFKKAIIDCLDNPKIPDSEVLESITGRTSIYQVIHQDEIRQKIEGLILENTANFANLKNILKRAEENKNRKGIIRKPSRMVGLIRMSDVAISHLLAERYLEEPDEFYLFVHRTLNIISAVNQNIATWDISGETADNYFDEKGGLFISALNEYQRRLNKMREKAKDFI